MPGSNSFCYTSRNTTGVSIFRIPTKDDEYSANWRRKLVHIVTKEREIDRSLKTKIDKRSLSNCELHYTHDLLLRRKYILLEVHTASAPLGWNLVSKLYNSYSWHPTFCYQLDFLLDLQVIFYNHLPI